MNLRLYAREGSALIIGKIISVLLQVYLLKVLTDFMEVSEYGQLALLLTFVTFSEIIYGAIGQSILRYYFISKVDKNYLSLRKSSIKIILCISILSSIFFILPYIYGYSLINCFALWLFSIFTNISTIISQIQNGERNRIISMLHDIFDKFFKLSILFILQSILILNLSNVLYSYLLSSIMLLIFNLYFYIKFIEKVNNINDTKKGGSIYLAKIIKFSAPTIIFLLVTWLSFNIDKWLIEYKFGSKELGYYNSIFQLGFMLVYVAINMLSVLVMPFFLSKIASINDFSNLKKYINLNSQLSYYSILPIITISVISYFISDHFLPFFINKAYLKYSSLFSLLILSGGLFGIGNMLSNNFVLNFKPLSLIIPKIIVSIISALVSYIMLVLYGIVGVILGNILSSIIYIIILIFMTNKYLNSIELVTTNA